MFKRSWYVLFLFAFLLVPLSASTAKAQELTVMTRNLYVGADFMPVIAAKTPEEFAAAVQATIGKIAASNFPERAQALAAEIVEKQPHLVGLQEVYNFTFNGSNSQPPFRDYLADLMAALAAQGTDYKVAAIVKNLDLQIPFGGNLVGVTDRDVILARGDVTNVSTVPVALSGCRPSVNGCNYQIVASAVTSVGTITIERGFVAVDAVAGTSPVRFVNTHLELPARELDPANPLSSAIQAAQAFELISILSGFPNPLGAKIVVVGDINSTPQDQVLVIGPYTIVPPYIQLKASYKDLWELRPGDPPGLTCCQAENLLNLDSILQDRRDVTFAGEMPFGMVKVNLVGNQETDKTPSGLWPSDHAGVVTRLEFAP